MKGTRFRPLSLDVPKPLFPIAGLPIIQHHIEACLKVPGMKEILLIGFHPLSEMQQFVQKMVQEYSVNIRYLQEYIPLGTGGGMYHFRDQIRAGSPDAFFFLHGDVCADFPLKEMLDIHQRKSNVLTILGTEATKQQSLNYGCIVEDKESHKVLHYVDKPSTFVSTLISCGVYVFSPSVFSTIAKVYQEREEEIVSGQREVCLERDAIYLEKEIISRLVVEGLAGVYQTSNWWSQIKSPAAAIYANRHYLALFEKQNLNRLTPRCINVKGDVYIHPTAVVDETALIGPNVSIGHHVVIGPGTRVHNSIILGSSVHVPSELIIRNSIVLPHKELSRSVNMEIVL
ncbi:hypothetical protein QYM36_014523 [Artemia franciscana]|uniref:Nucleotidyl transferase domain-containing protein n=1 Tax=Artemia franciscana TaxID=6661 RepID=A0AA88HNQ1_ARTSF|nr:hypothetical protein QYM36_014523 [Artemia franciscana]